MRRRKRRGKEAGRPAVAAAWGGGGSVMLTEQGLIFSDSPVTRRRLRTKHVHLRPPTPHTTTDYYKSPPLPPSLRPA